MHHKFAVVDQSLVVTGSFNWTTQAVNYNQENILFFENKDIAKKYTEEFNRLWDSFKTIIDQEEAQEFVDEEKANRNKNWNK